MREADQSPSAEERSLIRLRALSDVSGGMVHGFANLLNVVVAMCERVRSGAAISDEEIDRLEEAACSGGEVLRAVQDLAAGGRELREALVEPVEAAGLVQRSLAALGRRRALSDVVVQADENLQLQASIGDVAGVVVALLRHLDTTGTNGATISVLAEDARGVIEIRMPGDSAADRGVVAWLAAPECDFLSPQIEGFEGGAAMLMASYPAFVAAGGTVQALADDRGFRITTQRARRSRPS